MTEALRQAIDELATLPAQAQQKIGEELLLHVEKTKRLQAKLDAGIASLDRGDKQPLDIKAVISRARARYGKA